LEISKTVILLGFKAFKVKERKKGIMSLKGKLKGTKMEIILV
jgi:hypothetical protein